MKKIIITTSICFFATVFVLIPACKKKQTEPPATPTLSASYSLSSITAVGDSAKVVFTIQITNGTTYYIDFGDGSYSGTNSINSPTTFTVVHFYINNGNKPAIIYATNGDYVAGSSSNTGVQVSSNLNVIITGLLGCSFDVSTNGGPTETYNLPISYVTWRYYGALLIIRMNLDIQQSSSNDFLEISFPFCCPADFAGEVFRNKQPPYSTCDFDYVRYGQQSLFASANDGSCVFQIIEVTPHSIKGTFNGYAAGATNLPPMTASISNGTFYVRY